MLPLSQLRANALFALANMQHVLQLPAVDKHCSSEGHRTRLATADHCDGYCSGHDNLC